MNWIKENTLAIMTIWAMFIGTAIVVAMVHASFCMSVVC